MGADTGRRVCDRGHDILWSTRSSLSSRRSGGGAAPPPPPAPRDVCPSRWCITREDLDVFEREVRTQWLLGGIPADPAHPNPFHDDPAVGPNIYCVCEHYIKPLTQQFGGDTSWALMRNPHGLPCDVFVTHAWAEGVFEFTEKVRRLWPSRARHLWCCFLSNPQNTDIGALLGTDPMSSPFAAALAAAECVLVIPNRQQSIYTRLWCVFEADLALRQGKRIKLLHRKLSPREVVAVLGPAFLLLFITFAVGRWMFDGLAVLVADFRVCDGALLGGWLAVPCLVLWGEPFIRAFPRAASWATFLVVGLLMGLHFPAAGHCRCTYVGSLFALLVFTATSRVACALLALQLSAHSEQLEFDTVRSATCSDPGDEQRIREVLRGSEDKIDAAISALKQIGRYSATVDFNLAHGLRASRVRDGVWPGFVVAHSVIWAMGVICWVPMVWYDRWFVALSWSLAVLGAVYGAGGRAIFATDAMSWGSVGIYLSYQVLEVHWSGRSFHWSNLEQLTCSTNSPTSYMAVWAGWLLLALSGSALFFSGACGRTRERLLGLKGRDES